MPGFWAQVQSINYVQIHGHHLCLPDNIVEIDVTYCLTPVSLPPPKRKCDNSTLRIFSHSCTIQIILGNKIYLFGGNWSEKCCITLSVRARKQYTLYPRTIHTLLQRFIYTHNRLSEDGFIWNLEINISRYLELSPEKKLNLKKHQR